jgi:hypothetical protein
VKVTPHFSERLYTHTYPAVSPDTKGSRAMTPNGIVMTPAPSDVMAETRMNSRRQLLPGGDRAAQVGVRRRTDAAQASGLLVLFIGLVDTGSSAPAGSRHRRSGLGLGRDVVGPRHSGDNRVLASPRSYRPAPTSAGSGGGNGVVVVGGGAAGAAGMPGLWKSTIGSSRITLSPKLITRDFAVSR